MPIIKDLKLDKLLFSPPKDSNHKLFNDYNKQVLEERAKLHNDGSHRDILSYLISANGPESASSLELWAETNLLVIAGSDTTAAAFSAVLFYLVNHYDVLAMLNREVRTTFREADQIRLGALLDSCEYLRACLGEAMRLSPLYLACFLEKIEREGVCIAGRYIPKGTEVGVPLYAIHHNPAYYPEPFKYYPSRWITSRKQGIHRGNVDLARSAFCPVSAGTRGCVGKRLAYAELCLVLARTVFLHDMRLESASHVGEGTIMGEGWGRHREAEFHLKDA